MICQGDRLSILGQKKCPFNPAIGLRFAITVYLP